MSLRLRRAVHDTRPIGSKGTLQLQGRSEKGSWAGYLKTSERQQTVKTAC